MDYGGFIGQGVFAMLRNNHSKDPLSPSLPLFPLLILFMSIGVQAIMDDPENKDGDKSIGSVFHR